MQKKVVVIEFTKVDLPYGWLGNMYTAPIKYDGKVWKTSEALFQALRYDDPEIKEIIRNEKSPMSAKLKAKSKSIVGKMVIEPRSDKDLENMRMVVKLKFDQYPTLKSKLMLTGDHILVENIGKRSSASAFFWGMKKENGEWKGENMLGKILMELREEYKKEK